MTEVEFANPFLHCAWCGTPVIGVDIAGLDPCGHFAEPVSICPSWSPVDGCTCLPDTREEVPT